METNYLWGKWQPPTIRFDAQKPMQTNIEICLASPFPLFGVLIVRLVSLSGVWNICWMSLVARYFQPLGHTLAPDVFYITAH